MKISKLISRMQTILKHDGDQDFDIEIDVKAGAIVAQPDMYKIHIDKINGKITVKARLKNADS